MNVLIATLLIILLAAMGILGWTSKSLKDSQGQLASALSMQAHFVNEVESMRQRVEAMADSLETAKSAVDTMSHEKENGYLPEGVRELIEVATPLVKAIDTAPQSGEWKFHQVYAAVSKSTVAPTVDRWRIGLAIQMALANYRLEQS